MKHLVKKLIQYFIFIYFLGISIVGGRVEVTQKNDLPGQPSNTVFGIFIKSVIPDSPAGRSEKFFMGDCVISVYLIYINFFYKFILNKTIILG